MERRLIFDIYDFHQLSYHPKGYKFYFWIIIIYKLCSPHLMSTNIGDDCKIINRVEMYNFI